MNLKKIILLLIKSKEIFNENANFKKSIVILCRTNEIVKYMERLLISNSIPAKAIGSYNFFNRKEVKDIISLLKLVIDLKDDLSVIRVVKNFFNFKKIDEIYTDSLELSKNLVDYIELNYMKLNDKIINIWGFIQEKINNIFYYNKVSEWINRFVFEIKEYFGFDYFKKNNKDFFDLFLKFMDSFISKNMSKKDVIDKQKEEDLEKSRINFIEDLVNYVSLIRGNDIEIEDLGNIKKVIIMTIHSAKGLEFDYVFIPKVREGIIPHYKSEDIDEECRLFYVAITRAKEKLFITTSNPVSRFLLNYLK
jgi:DNA helicase-2/ATP-dependent DNA helicase PcrA